MRRRLVSTLLLAAALAAGTEVHRHPIFAEDPGAAAPASQVITSHREQPGGPHVHAVLRIVERESCWSCHWQRIFPVPSREPLPEPVRPSKTLVRLAPRSVADIARLTRLSRGPPVLV
jgi:hypothetical protein